MMNDFIDARNHYNHSILALNPHQMCHFNNDRFILQQIRDKDYKDEAKSWKKYANHYSLKCIISYANLV